MRRRKGFGLGQGFACNGGNMRLRPVTADIERQIIHFIGGRPFKGAAGFGDPRGVRKTGGFKRHELDLIIGDQQFRAHAAGFKCSSGFAQHGQFRGHVIRVKGHITNAVPSPRRAVQ